MTDILDYVCEGYCRLLRTGQMPDAGTRLARQCRALDKLIELATPTQHMVNEVVDANMEHLKVYWAKYADQDMMVYCVDEHLGLMAYRILGKCDGSRDPHWARTIRLIQYFAAVYKYTKANPPISLFMGRIYDELSEHIQHAHRFVPLDDAKWAHFAKLIPADIRFDVSLEALRIDPLPPYVDYSMRLN
jgi:hypothetical protein